MIAAKTPMNPMMAPVTMVETTRRSPLDAVPTEAATNEPKAGPRAMTTPIGTVLGRASVQESTGLQSTCSLPKASRTPDTTVTVPPPDNQRGEQAGFGREPRPCESRDAWSEEPDRHHDNPAERSAIKRADNEKPVADGPQCVRDGKQGKRDRNGDQQRDSP
jgi:hypothetical protein